MANVSRSCLANVSECRLEKPDVVAHFMDGPDAVAAALAAEPANEPFLQELVSSAFGEPFKIQSLDLTKSPGFEKTRRRRDRFYRGPTDQRHGKTRPMGRAIFRAWEPLCECVGAHVLSELLARPCVGKANLVGSDTPATVGVNPGPLEGTRAQLIVRPTFSVLLSRNVCLQRLIVVRALLFMTQDTNSCTCVQ